MDHGSAAHRHSASKTRVNALVALRSIRGTGRRGLFALADRDLQRADAVDPAFDSVARATAPRPAAFPS